MSNSSKKTILIIDDDYVVRKITERMVNSLGYSSICAVDGIDGLEKYRNNTIDVVILDIVMPRMNGREVLHELKK